MKVYSNELKKKMCLLRKEKKEPTSSIAKLYNVPLKTFEKWITAYNKNPRVFDDVKITKYDCCRLSHEKRYDYNHLTKEELILKLKEKDEEITKLKKRLDENK